MFDTLTGPMPGPPDPVALTRRHVSEADAERLVHWIAWHTGHMPADAGTGTSMDRLAHALVHWLDEGQRAQLARWLAHHLPAGLSPVPG